jgi:hypothetical protein
LSSNHSYRYLLSSNHFVQLPHYELPIVQAPLVQPHATWPDSLCPAITDQWDM